MEISIIIPVFNSEKIIPILIKEIEKNFVLKKKVLKYCLLMTIAKTLAGQ